MNKGRSILAVVLGVVVLLIVGYFIYTAKVVSAL